MTKQDQLREYAPVVWRREDLVEVRCIPSARKGGPAPTSIFVKAEELPSMHERLAALNLEKMNIYAGVLPRKAEGGRTDADCLGGHALWVDFDGVDPRDAWQKATSSGLPRPSMVVNSGHGAHLYWGLDSVWTTGVGVEPEAISALVGDMAALLGSDPTVKNPSRVLRPPGFVNWKEPVAECTLLYADLTLRYPFVEIRAIVPATKPSCADTPQAGGGCPEESGAEIVRRATLYAASVPGANEGGRNAAAYRLAANLRRDFSLSDAVAWSLLEDWNRKNIPPLGEKELRAVFQSAGRHAKHALGEKTGARRTNEVGPDAEEPARLPIRSAPACADLGDMRGEIEAQRRGERHTIPIPFSRVSDLARPLRPGTVCVLAGPPGVGKSYYTLSVARGVHEAGVPWRYLPLEDRGVDLKFRLLGLLAGTYETLDDLPETADRRAELLQEHSPALETFMPHICENPRVGHKDARGKTIVPPLPYRVVLDWVSRAFADKCRIVFIDPLSQIDFSGRDPWREESDFCRALLGMSSDAGATVVLIAHTIKRLGAHARMPAILEDLQGAAAFGRLCQTVLILDAHDLERRTVYRVGGLLEDVQSNRTLLIAKARNGAGTRQRVAFLQRADAPVFEELGVIAPRQKRKKKCKGQDDDEEQERGEL
jgi:hypothetical protein